MMRVFLTSLAFLSANYLLAQPPVKDGGNAQAPEPQPKRVARTLALVGEPLPALKYELLPPLIDRTPGNAALGYMQAATLRPEPPRDMDERKKLFDRQLAWDESTIDKLPKKEVAEFLATCRPMLRKLDEAARFQFCDWQHNNRSGTDAIAATLTSVQSFREMIRILKFRIQLEMAEGRHADVLKSLQTGLQFSKHVGEEGTLISMLVGYAMSSIMMQQVELWTERPGAPNLYWATTALPTPFIDPRISIDGERRFNVTFIPNLAEMQAGIVTEELATKSLKLIPQLIGGGILTPSEDASPLADVGLAALVALQGPSAKEDLAARGWKKADLDRMPMAQAIILRAVSIHQGFWDDQVKLFYLPFPKSNLELEKMQDKIEKLKKANTNDVILQLFINVYPAMAKVRYAHARTERNFAYLRTCEAVRLYAALHEGKAPLTLNDIFVPVPNDPMTDKPFVYEVTPSGFRLEANPPGTEKPNLGNAIILNVTWKK